MYVNGFVDVSCGNVLLRAGPAPNHLIVQGGDLSLNGRLLVSGNVGIGTGNPQYPLAINGGTNLANKQLAISANYAVSTINDTLGALSFYTNNFAAENARIQSCNNNNNAADNNADLRFFTRGDYVTFLERMRITAPGYVGIGTTAPYTQFHMTGSSTGKIASLIANTNTAVGSSACLQFGMWAASGSGTGTSSPAAEIAGVCMNASFGRTDLTFSTYNETNSLTERMRITNGGYVGIGTTNPTCPLYVAGGIGNTPTVNAFTYFNYNSTILGHTSASPGTNITLYCANDICAGSGICAANITSWSDERIKTKIVDIDDNVALIELRKLNPKTYEYIDKVKNPNSLVYGFIAQEVEQTIPYAVRIMKGYLPNIYEKATVTNGNRIILNNASTSTFQVDSNGKDASGNTVEIKFMDENNKEIITNLVSIIDDKTFEISDKLDITEVFVYGQEVNDFRTLDKDAIFTITTAAVQQIDREFQEAKSHIEELQTENADLKARLSSIEARLSLAGF